MPEHLDSRSDLPTRAGYDRLPELASGRIVGRFTLLAFLGEGGMGSVWLAEDPTRKDDRHDGRVVLKFLRDDIRRCPEAVEQFKAAYRKVQRLIHEHICPLLDLGEDPFVGSFQVMPYVKGVPLLELLKKEDPNRIGLSADRVIAILRPVAKALDYAHREGLIHRDIKPGNVMVDVESGKVFVVDFGLAAEVRTSMSQHSRSVMGISGTEPFMAPEQWLGQPQDGRSDQYSLAVVAWQMLTGSLPYQGSGNVLGFAVTQGQLPELPNPLQHLQPVMAQALAKDRRQRYPGTVAFVDALRNAANGEGSSTGAVVEAQSSKVVSHGVVPSTDDLASILQKTQESMSRKQTQARQLMEHHRYCEVAEVLAGIPEHLRDEALYTEAIAKRDRVTELEVQIRQAVTEVRLKGLRPLVQEFLALQPSREDMQRLLTQLPVPEDVKPPPFQAKTLLPQSPKAGETEEKSQITVLSRTQQPSSQCRSAFNGAIERINAGLNSRHYLLSKGEEEVLQWKREANQGVPEAQWLMGDCYLEGVHGCVNDLVARQWMQQASDSGLAWGHVTLASMLIKGIGGSTDVADGVHLLRKAISAGCTTAMHRLAMHLIGHEGKSQFPKAEELLREGAEAGHAGALHSLATVFLRKSSDSDSSSPQFIKSMKDAAAGGYIPSKVVLGRMMLGEIAEELVPVDVPAAISLLREAAAENHPAAITLLERHGVKAFRRRLNVENGPTLVLIPAGRFLMGSEYAVAAFEREYRDETPRHSVLITRDFWLSETVVTQSQYRQIVKKNPSRHKWSLFDGGKRPVEQVTWVDAVHYCNALSQREGLDQYYLIENSRVVVTGGTGYRLPTEAEWELACRAGTRSLWSWGSTDSVAEKFGSFGISLISAKTDIVGLRQCNDFGLYDMHGGVWEWCQDFYTDEYYSESPGVDPSGPLSGSERVARGGSYWENPWNCRSAVRQGYSPEKKDQDLGFRVARTV